MKRRDDELAKRLAGAFESFRTGNILGPQVSIRDLIEEGRH
jgi:hypothetical protein